MKELDICIGLPAFRVGRSGALASREKAFKLLDQAVLIKLENRKRHTSDNLLTSLILAVQCQQNLIINPVENQWTAEGDRSYGIFFSNYSP